MFPYDQRFDQVHTKQAMLPGFFFDGTARAASLEELMDQLPRQIHSFKNGISFGELFTSLTNESPVTSEIMKCALSELAQEGVIEVRDETGEIKRRSTVQKSSDIVIPKERHFFYGN